MGTNDATGLVFDGAPTGYLGHGAKVVQVQTTGLEEGHGYQVAITLRVFRCYHVDGKWGPSPESHPLDYMMVTKIVTFDDEEEASDGE